MEFQVDGESLVLNQYIDELYALTDEIFQRFVAAICSRWCWARVEFSTR